MPVTPTEVVHIASCLCFDQSVSSSDEACLRTSAGRAYYGAFLAVRHIARVALGKPNWNAGHGPFIKYLKGCVGTAEQVGEALDELYALREIADYHPQDSVDKQSVSRAVTTANWVLREHTRIGSLLDMTGLRALHDHGAA